MDEAGFDGNDLGSNDRRLAELIELARQGNQPALESLFSELRSYLLLVANDHFDVRLRPKLGPSDIVQQSMLRAVEQLEEYRGSTSLEFKGWLRKILLNEAKLARRSFATDKRDVQREVPLDSPHEPSSFHHGPASASELTPRSHALANEQAELVRRLIGELPEPLQTVIRLRNWDELSFEQIGLRLKMSTSGAAKVWYRALLEIQSKYQQLQNESRRL